MADAKKAHHASRLAAIVAFALASVKTYLFWETGSLIIGLSAWDSALDCIVSYINNRVILFARQDADADHPYGHGKAESLAALLQGALIVGGCIAIVGSTLRQIPQFLDGQLETVHPNLWHAGFFLVCAGISMLLSWYLKSQAKTYDSPALAGDAEHYFSDVTSNLASGFSIAIIFFFGLFWLDGIIAVVFATYVAWRGSQLVVSSVNELMDHVVEPEVEKVISEIISSCSPKILDVHNFRGRKSGRQYFFDFHITLSSDVTFIESHVITEDVELKIKERYLADVVIHTDPDVLPERNNSLFSRRGTQLNPL